MRIALGCALAVCVACGEVSQGATQDVLTDPVFVLQATTSAGISVDVFRYGTLNRTGTIPQASTVQGIEVDSFKYGTANAK